MYQFMPECVTGMEWRNGSLAVNYVIILLNSKGRNIKV